MSVPKIGEGKRGIEGYLLYLLRQTNTVVQHAINRELANLGLSLAQYSALIMIKAYKGVSNAELARLTLLRPQSVNEVVRRLDAEGLIERTSDPSHGRIVRLFITDKGKSLLAKARKRTDVIESELTRQAGPDAARIKEWLVGVAQTYSGDG